MGQALYRKYRSKSLDDVIGQEHITKTLRTAISSGRVSHAYLFTGPRGVGKTSIARIVAHEINGLPYTDESSYLDIIEIDAASNNGVEDVRALREKAYIAPASANYKVYIIDEVHMLSRPAFNALLKILEEPPAHVVFILATTEAHKLPDTIISRTQRYNFRPVELEKVVKHLRYIAEQEKISVDNDALELIARHGEGSFRDSISLLDQAANTGKKVTADSIRELLGIPQEDALKQLVSYMQTGNLQATASLISELYGQGYRATSIARQLSRLLRQKILESSTSAVSSTAVLALLAKLIDVPASRDPERYLEIILLQQVNEVSSASVGGSATEAASSSSNTPPSSQKKVVRESTAKQPSVTENAPRKRKTKIAATDLEQPVDALNSSPSQEIHSSDSVLGADGWSKALQLLKQRHNTLYGIINSALVDYMKPDVITITVHYSFHQKRLNEAKNKAALDDILAEASGGNHFEIRCVYDKDLDIRSFHVSQTTASASKTDSQPEQQAVVSNPLEAVSNIFGGGELIES